MTIASLIDRIPSRVLGMKTPFEIFERMSLLFPKCVWCTYFVRDHKPSLGKLDQRDTNCIFIG